jgi:membrane protein DedA with SNARE-associated domain
VKGWLAHLPHKYHQRATCMFDKHGLLALLAGRFWRLFAPCCPPWRAFPAAEPPLPVLQLAERAAVGWRGHRSGLCAEHDPFVKRHEDQVMTCLMILPIALLVAGLLGTVIVVIKKKYCNA